MKTTEETLNTSIDPNEQIAQRRHKLAELRKQGIPFPNDFRRTALAGNILKQYEAHDKDTLEQMKISVTLAGRIMLKRLMGKASFVHIQDMSGKIQLYLRRDDLPEGAYQAFKQWDLGDIIGVEGFLFRTKTGELSVHAEQIRLLTKSLRPLPDKYHGLTDKEMRYRQRYVDLIANPDTRRHFQIRSQLVAGIRQFLNEKDFLEVETPMMQTLAGGAAAKPFITHHNALDMELYLRIAPELYLKRLVVGGFERVFEINRNFRNEGLSTRHNPEFTMLEFYQAYADYHELMDLTETMIRYLAQNILNTSQLTFQGHTFDISKPFKRLSMRDSILEFNPEITADQIDKIDQASALAATLDIAVQEQHGLGKIQTEIFEKTVEPRLIEPTFITAYPTEVSPLARKNDENPFVTDRFEFFVGGQEIANGFSELNDPEDQAERFLQQAQERAAGDLEAMVYDTDYITALEYGLPPTAGEGIGIDRLVMLFTDNASIRDVILFPLLRPNDAEIEQ